MRFRPICAYFAMKKRKISSYLHSPMMPMPSLQLSQREQRLRLLLLDACQYINSAKHVEEPLVLRWAGGWVRDKILGIESHDIDVAINAMTGVQFAEHLSVFCRSSSAITRHAIKPEDIGGLHNVARNPEKSKHLETAIVKIFGLDLDFVNLRRETYAENSRNPQVEFGTAEEDALRRDATINALFYNLHNCHVEDYTGGLLDIAEYVIRTPLDPFKTFTDDPLRVLRLVRFASRLDFFIDPTTQKVMSQVEVLDALRLKVSRERVGIELAKMLQDPTKVAMTTPVTERWHVAYQCLEDIVQSSSPGSIHERLIHSDLTAYYAWNIAALSPWLSMNETPVTNRKAALPPAALVAREGFKAPKKLVDLITACHRHHEEVIFLKHVVCQNQPIMSERDRFGMAIRHWDAHGGSWTLLVLSALLVEAIEQLEGWSDLAAAGLFTTVLRLANPLTDVSASERKSFLEGWQRFLDYLVKIDVCNAPALKRLVDGHFLSQELGTVPGKWTGKALDVCMAWQLRNPGETDPRGAVEEVRRRREELGIATVI